MTYRFFAPLYAWCERIVFGEALQECRTAFLEQCQGRVLSIGEGDGRFSEALLAQNPKVDLKIVELDMAMRAQIKRRMPEAKFTTLEEAGPCDFIVLNFVLDLFTEEEASEFLDSLPPSRLLIVGDFFPEEVEGSLHRRVAQLLVWGMYRFFILITGLRTKQLPPIRDLLETRGWEDQEKSIFWRGLIQAQLWRR